MSIQNTSFPNGAPAYIKGATAILTDDLSTSTNAISSSISVFDCVDYKSVTFQISALNGAPWTGAAIFEASNDGTNWVQSTLVDRNGGGRNGGIGPGTLTANTSAGIQYGDIGARYIRVRQSSYTSGQIRVTAIFSAENVVTIPKQTLDSADNNIGRISVQSSTESGTLSSLNMTAGGVSDLAMMSQVQVQVTGTWSGTITWEGSIDGANWVSKTLPNVTDLGRTVSTSANGIWFGHLGVRYFRARMSTYTSGSAVVTVRYSAAASDMPVANVQTQARTSAGTDSNAAANVDMVALGAYSGGTYDRLRTAANFGFGTSFMGLGVSTGMRPAVTINAASAVVAGSTLDNTTARAMHTLQVDVTTATVGTTGTHTILLEASLEGTYWNAVASVTPSSTSTTAADSTNHAWASVTNAPYRYLRARWTSTPSSWTGTLTATIVSA